MVVENVWVTKFAALRNKSLLWKFFFDAAVISLAVFKAIKIINMHSGEMVL